MRQVALACAVWLGCEQRPRSDLPQRELLNPLKAVLQEKPVFVEPEEDSIEVRYNRHYEAFHPILRKAFEAVMYQDEVEDVMDLAGAPLSSQELRQACHLIRHYDKLTTVILEGSRVNRDDMKMLCESLLKLERLEDLDLTDCAIGDEGAEILSQYLPRFKSLRQLRLSRNNLGPSGVAAVCRSLERSQLVSLWLSHNTVGEEGAQALGKLLPTIKLEVMSLADTDCQAKEMVFIAPGIERSRRLKHLMLNDNKLCTDGIRPLSTRLPRSLEKMDFANTEMDSVGADLLSTGMSFMKELHTLFMECNHIGDSGIKALSVPLRTASKIEHINISKNGITELAVPFLICFIENNKKMRTFRATHSRFGPSAHSLHFYFPPLLHVDLRECLIYSHLDFQKAMPITFLELSTRVEF